MKRRQFFARLGFGSAALATAPLVAAGRMSAAAGDHDAHSSDHDGHDDQPLSGPLANATVSFGLWQSKDIDAAPPFNTELDRYPNLSPGGRNSHGVVPFVTTIKEGGSVNFIISGLHQVIVYAPGKRPDDVDSTSTRPTTGTPAGVPLINDPVDRVYAGLDPSTQTRDRVEVVQFPTRGLHLVICGVLDHFINGMFGYVRVLPHD